MPLKQPGQDFRAGSALSSGYIGRLSPLMTSYWKRLSHNGVAVPEPYLAEGLKVKVRGREVSLPPLAEEMAYHLATKKDTQYVTDAYLVTNFTTDLIILLPECSTEA